MDTGGGVRFTSILLISYMRLLLIPYPLCKYIFDIHPIIIYNNNVCLNCTRGNGSMPHPSRARLFFVSAMQGSIENSGGVIFFSKVQVQLHVA